MKRMNVYESAGDSDDEFIDSSSSPRDSDYEHLSSRKKRRGVIEKRRRDRINHCLVELRRLVPQAISKEGSTKLEKAEILQMTVDHLRSLPTMNQDSSQSSPSWPVFDAHASGFRECVDEISRYLISVEGFDVQHPLRLRLLSHLECFTERSLSPSSSSLNDADRAWTSIHQASPSAFATPPLSTYPSPMIDYHPHHHHHQQQQQQQPQHHHPHHAINPPFHMHHYHQPRPPVDSTLSLPAASSSSICF